MATILPDKEIKKLIGTVLIGADEKLIGPNGIQLCLGGDVLFHSTNEEKAFSEGHYLRVSPGENIIFTSLEKIDFSKETVQRIYHECALMAFITPTTTMMREGVSHASTKIDPGFHGFLNWGLRNNSAKDLLLKHGESMFKLTIMKLDKDEHPEHLYGDSPEKDIYQGTDGIKRSKRQIPADIPKDKIVHSGVENVDPKKRLKEAGYPFNHIGTELYELQGRFEVVSKDILVIRDQFKETSKELENKIEEKTNVLQRAISDLNERLSEKIDNVFSAKTNILLTGIGGLLVSLYSLKELLVDGNHPPVYLILGTIIGVGILVLAVFIGKKK